MGTRPSSAGSRPRPRPARLGRRRPPPRAARAGRRPARPGRLRSGPAAGPTQVSWANARVNRPDSGTISSTRSPGRSRGRAASSVTKMLAAPVLPAVCRLVNQRLSSGSWPACPQPLQQRGAEVLGAVVDRTCSVPGSIRPAVTSAAYSATPRSIRAGNADMSCRSAGRWGPGRRRRSPGRRRRAGRARWRRAAGRCPAPGPRSCRPGARGRARPAGSSPPAGSARRVGAPARPRPPRRRPTGSSAGSGVERLRAQAGLAPWRPRQGPAGQLRADGEGHPVLAEPDRGRRRP